MMDSRFVFLAFLALSGVALGAHPSTPSDLGCIFATGGMLGITRDRYSFF
jgi:hypothetical protein